MAYDNRYESELKQIFVCQNNTVVKSLAGLCLSYRNEIVSRNRFHFWECNFISLSRLWVGQWCMCMALPKTLQTQLLGACKDVHSGLGVKTVPQCTFM